MNNTDRHTKTNMFLLFILVILFYTKLDKIVLASPNINNISNTKSSNNVITLKNCVDGDTANFSTLGKTRFLLVDTPESAGRYKKKPQYKGKDASNFTCSSLKKAKKITYEYDGPKKDKYDRSLAYIFVDGKLLQEELAKQGYVKKLYLYKSYYKYEKRVRNSVNDKYGIWEN